MAVAKAQPSKQAAVLAAQRAGARMVPLPPPPKKAVVVKKPVAVVKAPQIPGLGSSVPGYVAPRTPDDTTLGRTYEWGPGNANNPGPNYGADLVGAPDFTEANANYQYNVDLAHKQRQSRIRAALIKLGFQPGSADANALAGIDPSTAELAQQNSASALAKLGLQRGTDRADLSAQLASRGLLDSGALRGGENMVQSSYDQGLLGATQDYLNEQNTALGDEASTLATGQQTYTAAKAAAALLAAKNPLFTPTLGAAEQGDTLAPGQGTRPDQTPVLNTTPPVIPQQPVVKPPARKPVAVGPPPGAKLFVYQAQAQAAARPGQTVKFHNGRYYLA